MKINQWLSNPKRTFADGLTIYNEVKRSIKFDAFFAKRKNVIQGDVEFNMLEVELRNINRIKKQYKIKEPLPAKGIVNEASETKKTVTHKIAIRSIEPAPATSNQKPETRNQKPKFYEDRYNPNELPDDLRKLYENNKGLNTVISSLHANLKALAPGKKKGDAEKRKDIRLKLDELENNRNKNRETIDDWWNKRNDISIDESPVEIAKKIESARKYLGRFYDSKKTAQIEECQRRIDLLKKYGITWKKKK